MSQVSPEDEPVQDTRHTNGSMDQHAQLPKLKLNGSSERLTCHEYALRNKSIALENTNEFVEQKHSRPSVARVFSKAA